MQQHLFSVLLNLRGHHALERRCAGERRNHRENCQWPGVPFSMLIWFGSGCGITGGKQLVLLFAAICLLLGTILGYRMRNTPLGVSSRQSLLCGRRACVASFHSPTRWARQRRRAKE